MRAQTAAPTCTTKRTPVAQNSGHREIRRGLPRTADGDRHHRCFETTPIIARAITPTVVANTTESPPPRAWFVCESCASWVVHQAARQCDAAHDARQQVEAANTRAPSRVIFNSTVSRRTN